MENMPTPPAKKKKSLYITDARTRRRNAAEKRFRAYGIAAIVTGLIFLLILGSTILKSGLPAFKETVVKVEFTLTKDAYLKAEKKLFKTKEYAALLNTALLQDISNAGLADDLKIDNDAIERIMGKPGGILRDFYTTHEEMLDRPVAFNLAVGSRVDGYIKGRITRDGFVESRFLKTTDLDLVDILSKAGIIQTKFNWNFITGVDAGVDNAGGAGIGASVMGSFYMMLVVLGLSLPIGVAAAIYLEEFSTRNWITDLIEVNISNLAAVPSIVFGILGLSVFIQFMHLPQSAPLVGGLVLSLMTLPRVIIPARAALRAVPPSIRDAALGVGASKMQSVFHHVLPLAVPGILTGIIIGLAQALGETAPLLLIGMVGFVAREYADGFISGFVEPNSAMPAQIYTWAARADTAFYEKAWGGIIILLAFLLTMNIIAVILRRRFERRW